jgi:hypothetical protein
MPLREKSVMEQRQEFVRLAGQDGVNRRELCRRFGISAGHRLSMARPHEALQQAVPAVPYRPSPRPMPERLLQPDYQPGEIIRTVGRTKAYINVKGRLWPVGQAFFGERLAIRPRAADGQYGIYLGAHEVASIDLTKPAPVSQVSDMSPH